MADETKTDETDAAPAAEIQAAQPTVKMLAHFVRDLSFENVGAREGTQADGQPEINVNVGMDAKGIADNRYLINMKVNATAKTGEAMRFLVELEYSGVFQIDNAPESHLHPILFIECPRQLLPFTRRVVADVTRDGGYPPLMLDNVDFATLYRQRIEQLRAEKAEKEGAGNNEALN